jgi:hypothetical protein
MDTPISRRRSASTDHPPLPSPNTPLGRILLALELGRRGEWLRKLAGKARVGPTLALAEHAAARSDTISLVHPVDLKTYSSGQVNQGPAPSIALKRIRKTELIDARALEFPHCGSIRGGAN